MQRIILHRQQTLERHAEPTRIPSSVTVAGIHSLVLAAKLFHWSQACDLKSAVSEHARDVGHSIDWAGVEIIGPENNLLSRKIR